MKNKHKGIAIQEKLTIFNSDIKKCFLFLFIFLIFNYKMSDVAPVSEVALWFHCSMFEHQNHAEVVPHTVHLATRLNEKPVRRRLL